MKNKFTLLRLWFMVSTTFVFCCSSIAQNFQSNNAAVPVKLHKSVLLKQQKNQPQAEHNGNLSASKNSGFSGTKTSSWCASDKVTENYIFQQTQSDPDYPDQLNKMYNAIQQWINNNPNYLQQKALKSIPVVVHVVYNTPDENVSNALIYDMINTLNEDFQRLNSDTNQTRTVFKPVAADAQIEFCLAQRDPSNNATTGITRTATTKTFFDPDTETDDMKQNSTGGEDAWDPFNYLNIWIADIDNGAGFGTAGYAYLPTPGMHGSWRDGLVIDNSIGLCYGCRTATHEIGHYLGLKHTWGNNPPSCTNDDGFADTPGSSNENFGCNTSQNTCNDGPGDLVDQIENYMSYADCQNMFSADQANYMNSVLNTTRSSLLNSQACQPTAPPVADFNASDTVITAGQYIQFFDQTTGGATSWAWTFGGGGTPNTSASQNPFIQFNTIGTYDASLTATNSLGSDIETKISYITVLADTTNCDTINWGFLSTDTSLTIYGCGPACGNVVGTNQYDDLAKAQLFTAPEYSPNTHITGGLFYFAYAYKSGTSNGKVVFTVWDDDGTGGAPNTVLGTDTVDLADIVSDVQGGYLTQSLFIPPVAVSGDYYYGFQMVNFDNWAGGTSDTLALVQTTDGVSASASIPWEQWSDNSWADFVSAWGFTSNTIFATPYMTDMPPTASFTADTIEGCGTLTVNFDASASVNGVEYYWDVDGDDTLDYVTYTPDIAIQYNAAGTYGVSLWVVGACDGIDTMTISNYINVYDVPVLTTSSNSSSCGACDGDASVSISGGTGPFTYLWDDPAPAQTTATATGLCTGAYNVLVNDGNNCSAASGVSVDDAGGLTISTTATNENCGAGNGTATAVVASTPQTINISVSDFVFTPNSVNATVGDTISWIWVSGTHTTTSGVIPGGASSWDNPISSGNTNFKYVVTQAGVYGYYCTPHQGMGMVGVINVSAPSYSYAWSTSPVQTNDTATGLSSGAYHVTVTDGNGCVVATDFFTAAVVNNIIDTFTFSVSIVDASCAGDSDGTATVTPSGGNSPYTFQWDASAGSQTTAIATGLAAGNYSVTATDGYGCDDSTTVTVSEPAPLSVDSILVTDALCSGDTGFADAYASGGTGSISFSWSNGENSASLADIAGTYTLTVTDVNSCTDTSSAIISEPLAVTVDSIVVADVSCNGGNDGSAQAFASGGNSAYSYLWSSGDATQSATGLSTGTYIVTVSDANGCTGIDSAAVAEPDALVLSPTVDTADCAGGTASTYVNVSGGTSPYTYLWIGGNTFAGGGIQPAGTYGVTVTDANNCSADTFATVYEPDTLVSNFDYKDVTCNTADNGSAWVDPSGGTSPYSVSWSLGGTTDTITGLAPGDISVTVTDANGCTAVDSTAIAEPAALSMTASVTDPTCFGGNDGSVSVTVSGGTTPYTYLWGGGQTGTSVTGLGAGTYSITATDQNGCTLDSSFTLTDPSALAVDSVLADSLLCNGDNNGSAEVFASGGTGALSYSWSSGSSLSNESNLSAGDYFVTITDANSCTLIETVTIPEPAALTAVMSGTDETTAGANDGSATSTPSGGTGSYTYLWNNSGTTQTISGLSPGSYIVTVSDANGCDHIDSTFVNAAGCTLVIDSTEQTNVACFGGNEGTASVFASNGSGTYSYAWSNGQTTQTATGLTAGSFGVTVTDDLVTGCKKSTAVIITQPASAVNDTVAVAPPLCSGGMGSAISTPSGGVSPYSFEWSTGGTASSEDSLSAGNYSLTITDANGCTVVKPFTVTEPSALAVSVSATDETSFGANDGTAAATASGGTAGYTYLWSNAATTSSISSLSPGAYCVTVTDANACTASACDTVIAFGCTMTVTASAMDVSACVSNDAMAVSSVSGGASPFTYNWSNGATTEDISNVASGTYSLTVTDFNNCIDIKSVMVIDDNFTPAIDSVLVTQAISCNTVCDGEAAVYATGGGTPYSYAWSDLSSQSTQTASGLCAGTYDVTVTETSGSCTASSSVVLSEPSALAVTAAETDLFCKGDSSGTATAVATGGTVPYTFDWSNGGTGSAQNDLAAGSYSVTSTDANGCTAVASVTIAEPAALANSMTSTDESAVNANDGSATAMPVGGTSPYTYDWNDGQATETATGLAPGDYAVTITDNNGCTLADSVTINAFACNLVVSATATDETFAGGNDGTATASATGGTPAYTYSWSNGAATTSISGLAPGTYCVTVTDAAGCSDSTCVTVNAVVCNLTVSAMGTDETSFGANDGTAMAMDSSGTSPFTYSWSNGSAAASLTGLAPGAYCVTVTDSLGCTDSACVTINAFVCNLSVNVTATDETAAGANDGTAMAATTGGTTPFTYLWSPGGQSTQNISGLAPGTYCVTITDSDNCTASACDSVLGAVSTAEISGNLEVLLYPNPVRENLFITVSLNAPGKISVEIRNYLGQMVQSIASEKTTKYNTIINTEKWSSGVYFVSVVTEDGVKMERIVIE